MNETSERTCAICGHGGPLDGIDCCSAKCAEIVYAHFAAKGHNHYPNDMPDGTCGVCDKELPDENV